MKYNTIIFTLFLFISIITGQNTEQSGCTDPYADNYDSTATIDDGSCSGYPENGEYSLNFDGVNDYVGTETSLLNDVNQFTMAGWITPESAGNREVKTLVNQTQDAGYRSVVWDATNDYGKPVSAGIYLYQIQAGEYISTKKMVLLK
tara:strand:- start:228 stop:668 length:441 start_codon:yes stop_codon:yes gene_type:complete